MAGLSLTGESDQQSSNTKVSSTSFWSGRNEAIGVAGLLLGFFIFNFVSLMWFPPVWNDEVCYADPAINLLTQGKFESSVWHAQPGGEFWAGNVPLYSLALFVWLKGTGLSIEAVRSFNLFLMALAALSVWGWSRRADVIASAGARLLFLFYILFAFGMTLSYRSGRPDCLNMLLCSGLLWALWVHRPDVRIPALLVLSALLAFAGFQSLTYVAILMAIAFLFWRKPRISDGVTIGVGFGIGLVSLYCLYSFFGVWEGFRKSISFHSENSFMAKLLSGQFTLRGFVPADPSLFLLIFAGLLLIIIQGRKGIAHSKFLAFALSSAIALQVLMPVLGRYPTYYSYMAHFPLAVAIAHVFARATVRTVCIVASGALIFGGILGAPVHLLAALADPSGRDYTAVEQLVDTAVKPGEWVFCEPAAYYAVREKTERYFTPLALTSMRESERQQVSVIVGDPAAVEYYRYALGGKWSPTGEKLLAEPANVLGIRWKFGFLTLAKYNLEIWRRLE